MTEKHSIKDLKVGVGVAGDEDGKFPSVAKKRKSTGYSSQGLWSQEDFVRLGISLSN